MRWRKMFLIKNQSLPVDCLFLYLFHASRSGFRILQTLRNGAQTCKRQDLTIYRDFYSENAKKYTFFSRCNFAPHFLGKSRVFKFPFIVEGLLIRPKIPKKILCISSELSNLRKCGI
jgi:hypothetical protein